MHNAEDKGPSETETQTELSEEERRQLEASGQYLEGSAVVDGVRRFLVLVHRVDYGGGSLPAGQPGVIRFSERKHSLQVSPRIKLSSPQYYRELEENSAARREETPLQGQGRKPGCESDLPGIGDEMEARYQKEYSLEEYHRRFIPELANAPVTGSAKATYETSGLWILSTSVRPETGGDLERLWNEFQEYDYATIIPSPSEFALQLGKDFGSQYGEGAIRTNVIGIVRQARIAQAFVEAGAPAPEVVVDVRHGQVVYDDNPADLIELYPPQFQGMVLPFVKRKVFEGQEEYRFTVSLGGEPKRQRICVDVSDELRSLAHTSLRA